MLESTPSMGGVWPSLAMQPSCYLSQLVHVITAVVPLTCVLQLSEFSPRNPGLLGLNVNRGAEVKIRLRPARDDDSFYDWHHILGTMLHEVGSMWTAYC